jgi:cysteine-rich repeat protein
MRLFRLKYVLPSVLALIATGIFLHAPHLLAQVTDSLVDVGAATGLSAEDPKVIIARIIRVVIGVLGVLSVLIVLYGGFMWMTAAGNEDKLTRAKKILISGTIGLAIILLSFAIASFVISALLGATGAGGGNGSSDGSGGGFGGSSSTSSFTVTDYSPDGPVAIRNILLRVTFSKNLDATTLAGNLVVTNATSGEVVSGTITASGNTASFRPNAACPSPNEDRFCFDADTPFTVTVSESVKSSGGATLVCTTTSCTSSFTSGNLVDTEDPTAVITVPSGSVESGSSALVQVHATDDSEVADATFSAEDIQFDSVGASGDDLSDTTIETAWDTTALENGTSYQLATTVTDIAGNTSSDTIHVTARGPWCFDGTVSSDHGETGIDCGGDSTSADYCGACSESSCTTDADCGPSYSCVDSVCTSLPEITDISPLSGAVGTFVTISGIGFGSTPGTVTFTAADGGTVVALTPSCATWSTTGLVVMVPFGAVTGPITVTTAATIPLSDSSGDDYGEIFDDFVVNDVIHPKLCSLLPTSGAPTDAVVLSGLDFGDTQSTSTVSFGTNPAGSYSGWSDTSIQVTAPSARNGSYQVGVTVDGVASNTILYNLATAVTTIPIIASINPASAAIGDYITLTGSNFGADIGAVYFENKDSGYRALASVEFPTACSDYWSDTQVIVIVPANYQNGDTVEPSDRFSVFLVAQSTATSASTDFTITSDAPSPGICSISPSTGAAGDTVTITGSLGSATGSVDFWDSIPATLTGAWNNTTITVTAPTGATSGPVQVTSASGVTSNTLNFTFGDSATTTIPPGPSAYQWYFSTGTIPTTPAIVSECDLASGGTISAVPSSIFTSSVCPQAVVYAEFTELMNEGTIDDAVTVGLCSSATCSATTDITAAGILSVSSSTVSTAFTWVPNTPFSNGASYLVTVSTAAISSPGGIAMAADYSWHFTVSSTGAACAVNNVSVAPATSTIAAEGNTDTFNALPSDDCIVLDATSYVYDWSVDDSIASLTSDGEQCLSGSSSCTLVQANAEGTTDVTAEETASNVSGNAVLTINFTDPYVADYWPSCDGACRNGLIGASFNTAMDATTLVSPGAVKIYTCQNELCNVGVSDEYTAVTVVAAACDSVDSTHCQQVDLNLAASTSLTPGTFYRVVIDGSVATPSGVALTRTNYSGDYSWIFGVKTGTDVCAVNRLAVTPDNAVASQVGERENFTVSAYGVPDACSTSGELLATTGYNWSFDSWTDNGASSSLDVASWLPSSQVDTDKLAIAAGCTSLCTPGGSQAYSAICGDGLIDTTHGEECEDGATASGDGCSSSCLREGANGGTAWLALCGDGHLDRDTADGSGEDCDDGNTVDGDGCSAVCLNEGSRSVRATCGNSDIAYDAALGGEDCDDGNVANGDGCSSICLSEGTPSMASIGSAWCGDGRVTDPYETCDDGESISGDGCSATCLREGMNGGAYWAPLCGNGATDRGGSSGAGEDCDGGEDCSADCTFIGSSTTYITPSFCGDGTVGTGEYLTCEAAIGDGNVDDTQLAEIDLHAAQEVDIDTNMAIASMFVTEPVSGISTELTPTTYTLICSALQDSDCSAPTTIGVGINNCCMDRPTVTLYPNGGAECRNAEIYGLFTSEMDLSTFETAGVNGATAQPLMFAKLDLASTADGVCPADHTSLAMAATRHLAWYSRGWLSVRQLFTGRVAEAATGDCVVPVASYSQEAVTDSFGAISYKVVMHYDIPLQANADYTLEVITDSNTADTSRPGVHSVDDVAMYDSTGFVWQNFTTGSDICTLDSVVVTDGDTDSPEYFSQATETHTFTATAYAWNGTTSEPIESLSTAYAWDWSWTEDMSATIVTVTGSSDADTLDTAVVEAVGKNGDANVIATATITVDTLGTSEGSEVAGTDPIIAFLCENAWPDIRTTSFPWSDSDLNFSDYYCRDTGAANDTTDDYPALTVVDVYDYSATDNILQEYLFEVASVGTGDAIGYRVVTNSGYLSPLAWYTAQGFAGDPTVATVDGFQAVVDGRTTYVAAVNESGTALYPNIYVISYNEGASEETIAIYDQLVANISFAINITDVALCSDGSAFTAESCVADTDCATGATCANSKIKLTRDLTRLSDLRTIAAEVVTADFIPTLSSGTFVRGLGASVWTSWSDILGGALGDSDLLADPLNAFVGCGTTPFDAYDATTCVNQTNGQYVCPAGSYAYHYRALGDVSYNLYADLEYAGAGWYYDYDTDATDTVNYQVSSALSTADGFTSSSFCNDTTIYGSTGVCGDGVVNGSEACEIGQRGGTTITCDIEPTVDTDGDGAVDDELTGIQSQICDSTCSAFIADSTASCVVSSCGDGVTDTSLGETCDDGSLNGRYGYCGSLCNYTDSFYCGDGSLAGSEACDCSSSSSTYSADSRPYGGLTYACGGSSTYLNGDYYANPNNSCAWDCQGPASYCGDGTIDSGEVCDGNSDSYEGAICDGYSGSMHGEACVVDADCRVDATIAFCGHGTAYEACPSSTVCLTGDATKISAPCTSATVLDDCGLDANGNVGTCSSIEYQTYRTRVCEDDGENGTDQCDWADATIGYEGIDCKALGSCGDGVVDTNEECDDGNSDSGDTCTNACTINVCGDGYLQLDTEQCDEGADNGEGCTSAYESTCTSCSVSCKYTTSSGEFCGDGVTNGHEYCDAYDLPSSYVYAVDLSTVADSVYLADYYDDSLPAEGESFTYVDTTKTCAALGDTTVDTLYDSDATNPTISLTCQTVGQCNGGSSTDLARGLSATCLTDADCSSGDCQFPICASSCNSTCPETFQSSSIMLTDNQPGSPSSSSVDLYTYSESTTSDLPNAASLTFPACRVGATLTADISLDSVTSPDVYVVFVTDLSDSMNWDFSSATLASTCHTGDPAKIGLSCTMDSYCDLPSPWPRTGSCYSDSVESRIYTVRLALQESLSALYGVDNMNIALLGYSTMNTSTTTDDIISTAFEVASGEVTLYDAITAYTAIGGTPTNEGLDAAYDLLQATSTSENSRKIVVLLTDGLADDADTTGPSYGISPLTNTAADRIKDVDSALPALVPDYELYTIALTTDQTLIEQVASWSSNDTASRSAPSSDGTIPSELNGVDYAYHGSSSSAITDAYNSIIASITQPTFTLVTGDGATSGPVVEGTGVALPWPEGFACDQTTEQTLPIRVSFAGEGQINISNVKFNYCSP